jgi:hypothetical protein
MEALLATFLCGTMYSLLSGQPLTIVSTDGPVLVFETILFTFSRYTKANNKLKFFNS